MSSPHPQWRAAHAVVPDNNSPSEIINRKQVAVGKNANHKGVRFGMRGKLRMLTEMPFDILFEVK